jgi:hypothetical protein
MSSPWLRAGGFVLLAFCFVGLTGCGSGGRAKVKGRVKFFDKYLTAGTVAFIAKDGRVGSGNIDADGNYEVSDAPVGDVTITVKVPSMGGMPDKGRPQPKPPKDVPPMKGPGGDAGEKAFNPSIDPSKIIQIPGKYGSADTSGLTYTVTKGEQTHNITLSP